MNFFEAVKLRRNSWYYRLYALMRNTHSKEVSNVQFFKKDEITYH